MYIIIGGIPLRFLLNYDSVIALLACIYYLGSVIHQQPMVIDPAVADQKPPNNIEFAIIACLCCNGLCLGLIALCFALRSDAAYQKGKVN